MRSLSSTCLGFCAVTAESRYARGLPLISCAKIGKSARIRFASSFFVVWTATDLSYPGGLGLPPAARGGLVRAVGAEVAAVAAAPVPRAVDEDAAARMRLAAAEAGEAVLADRLEQPERRRRGEELDPRLLVGAVAKAPLAAHAYELRRPAV